MSDNNNNKIKNDFIEGVYQHQCLTCGSFFLEKGKFAFDCERCKSKRTHFDEQFTVQEFVYVFYTEHDNGNVRFMSGAINDDHGYVECLTFSNIINLARSWEIYDMSNEELVHLKIEEHMKRCQYHTTFKLKYKILRKMIAPL